MDGHILQVLQDKDASHIFGVSGCMEHAGKLYMGHLMGDFVSVLDLKEVAGQGFVGP